MNMTCNDCLLFDGDNSICKATGDAESPTSGACEEFQPIVYDEEFPLLF